MGMGMPQTNNNNNNFEPLYWIEHFNLRLAVINVCPVKKPNRNLTWSEQ